MRDNNYKLVFLDETMFTRRAISKFEWSHKNENIEFDDKLLNDTTLALLIGISAERGIEHWRIFKKSVNTDKFIEYLEELRQENEGK